MKVQLPYAIFFCSIFAFQTSGCTKYLDAKANKSYEVPHSLQDGQALIDYYPNVNFKDAGAGEVSADDYYLPDNTYTSLPSEFYKRMYVWERVQIFAPEINDWYNLYSKIYVANTVLTLLNDLPRNASNGSDWDNLKGQALFLRGRCFLQAVTIWSGSYNPATATSDLGIPLRLNINFNENSVRSSNQQSYDQILSDLKEAAGLLPEFPLHPVRASRPAADGLIARTYLAMNQYDSAWRYSDLALQEAGTLVDFNNLDSAARYPFAGLQYQNPEIIFESRFSIPLPLISSFADIDTTLYDSYASGDLRKQMYFQANPDGSHQFKGSYEGSLLLFSGVATDECLLMRAESSARMGQIGPAMNDLNSLMIKRWDNTRPFIPATATSQSDAVSQILSERRKELLMRGLRWIDLKRLNETGAGIVLTRKLNGQVFTLSPNSTGYALPIPEDIISISGMKQNP